MAENIDAEASAEKAYAAAAEAASPKPAPAAEAVSAKPAPAAEPVETVEFPSKVARASKPKASAPAAAEPKRAPKQAKPRKAAAKPATLKAATVTRKAKTKAVKAKAKPAIKPVAAVKPKIKPKTTPKPAVAAKPATAAKSVFQQLKDKTMDTAEITSKMKSAVADVQVKAKEAYDKGAAAFGEYNEFSKGNLEAVVESGKILASGMQTFGTTLVADTKANFETLTAEVKELASVKSPTDFFKLQAAFVKRNFDLAVAQTSKNSEAVLKLASEAAAPISGRVSLAVEKIKKAA